MCAMVREGTARSVVEVVAVSCFSLDEAFFSMSAFSMKDMVVNGAEQVAEKGEVWLERDQRAGVRVMERTVLKDHAYISWRPCCWRFLDALRPGSAP